MITNVVAEELPGIKNIVIHKTPKTYDNVIFLDKNDQKININEYAGNLLILINDFIKKILKVQLLMLRCYLNKKLFLLKSKIKLFTVLQR